MTLTEWMASLGHIAYIVGSYAVGAAVILIEVWMARARLAKAQARASMPQHNTEG